MDFETVLKVLVAVAAAVAIPVGAYAAIVATRAIWVRGEPGKLGSEELQALHQRVTELEDKMTHVGELEERLDFAERLLAQRHDAVLPRGEG